MELRNEDPLKNGKLIKKGSEKRRSGREHGENMSSKTSASPQSPISMIQGETKSSASSSRNRRHFIS
ncbi:hypothetical protein RJ639_030627 [Escallonia herrerae]|uniref:Uncharacterized protein n=1 Tax=Escallonia herrerae TaxID=1293975 RepID=A0AA88X0J6_9ASTE|nr:hypothetical protein RJ639_030627 [Escallonia herrerae]